MTKQQNHSSRPAGQQASRQRTAASVRLLRWSNLLIVVGIIALLISLLLPALQRTHAHAYTEACQNKCASWC